MTHRPSRRPDPRGDHLTPRHRFPPLAPQEPLRRGAGADRMTLARRLTHLPMLDLIALALVVAALWQG